ncbi:MAG: hypothetical protein AAF565_11650 [Pseudomonadota bacterium]
MTHMIDTTAAQLGFDALLADAEADNRAHKFAGKTAHLPGTMAEATPYFRVLIDQNHAAVMAANEAETRRLHEEVRLLAEKLDKGSRGILAHDDAPGNVLARETKASVGSAPLWGQTGAFVIEAAGMAVRIEMEGMFGIGSGWGFWPGFAAHAVDPEKPFLSETGYRSFLGLHADPMPGHTPQSFTHLIIERYVADALGGRPLEISDRWKISRGTDR